MLMSAQWGNICNKVMMFWCLLARYIDFVDPSNCQVTFDWVAICSSQVWVKKVRESGFFSFSSTTNRRKKEKSELKQFVICIEIDFVSHFTWKGGVERIHTFIQRFFCWTLECTSESPSMLTTLNSVRFLLQNWTFI